MTASTLLSCGDPHKAADRYSANVKKAVVVGLLPRKISYRGGLHGNWGEKTLHRSTPRRPGSSLFLLAALAVVSKIIVP